MRSGRTTLSGPKRYRSHRALRQVLEAAVRWKWIEENPATLVKNPAPPAGELHPFESWEEIDTVAVELGDRYGPLVVCLAGTGLRPEEAFVLEWRDVDLEGATLTVRRALQLIHERVPKITWPRPKQPRTAKKPEKRGENRGDSAATSV